MKRLHCIIAVGLLALLAACRAGESEPSAAETGIADAAGVAFAFDVGDVCYATRSATVSDESGIRNLNLFLYRGGRLEWQEYRTSAEAFSLNLLVGETYSAYALANVGEQTAPSLETGIHDFALDLSALSTAGRLPMATVSGVSFTVSSGGADNVVLPLTRLVAKYSFQVDRTGLQYGSFSVTSVRVRQAASRVGAFVPGSAASASGQVTDGDYASAADLASLNADGAVSFYLPENAQGTLLAGNTDPWRKEYFDPSVASRAPLCTYLEVKGRYTDRSGGLGATHTYRMFLGDDATTNFDVLRNTAYTLTLAVSDLGVFRESWKVDRGEVTDSRTLRFDPPLLDIPSQGSAATAVVCNPSGVDYTLQWDETAFSAASLDAPAQTGNQVTLRNRSALEADATAVLRAVSFDGAVSAACTLRVSGASLPALEPQWLGTAPAYVAQAGTVRVGNLSADGGALSAASSDPSVARLVAQDGDYRVEALKEGSATLTFTQTVGTRTRSGSLAVTVAPVYLQGAGTSYRAFADGASNARRIGGAQEPWTLSYDLPRSAFDDALYDELLAPRHTAVRSGSSAAVDYFEVSEDGLYVVDWGSDLAGLPGSYTLSLRPRADIYAGAQAPLQRTVVVDAPLTLPAGVFEGENRYYMPEPGTALSLVSSAAGSAALGDPSSLRISVGFAAGYSEGSGQLVCPYAWSGSRLCLTPSYASLTAAFPQPYRFRGASLQVHARLTNARSGRTADYSLGTASVWLALAVTARLASWGSRSDWDITDEDHFFLIPCLYDERFSAGMVTFQSSQVTGDPHEPPFYIPRALLTGIPDAEEFGGATVCLSEELPMHQTRPAYQLSDAVRGLRCPDITNWLWQDAGWSEGDFERDAYQDLAGSVGGWYHRKLYWSLRNPSSSQPVPDGGHVDIESYGGVAGSYYLRIYDAAEPMDASDFDE